MTLDFITIAHTASHVRDILIGQGMDLKQACMVASVIPVMCADEWGIELDEESLPSDEIWEIAKEREE